MKDIIRSYAPGVKEVFASVEIQEKTKSVEFESKLFSSKSALSGLKDHTLNLENKEQGTELQA